MIDHDSVKWGNWPNNFWESFQPKSDFDKTRTSDSAFEGAKAKRNNVFCCSATVEKQGLFWAQGAHDKHHLAERLDWHTEAMPWPKDLDSTVGKHFIRNPIYMDSADLN